ncbi:alpha/beta hydrolase [Mesobacillus subterraneus]|uniref:alpha/beta fold hydrolase n=1 Tax=Mesobacillus subterraneus TaxID=285983 RepID=UPI0020407B83|nr:alpha/beta hydrolase [Mesobacillus subterraneus]MCM3664508.1 alpha/beta hydrolase [Mesobacillus subterraneus]MCM3683975.1 alpha/beta hydrolase [Mesobacillus subterraneus]
MKTIYKSQEGKEKILSQYEEYLAQFDSLLEREYVQTRFGSTHVLKMGKEDGKPLFIFQGGNCINPVTLSWFKGLLKEYKIYAPDTIGHPGYSDETRISASDKSFAHWIHDLMDYYQIERCGFIGPSYGAGIILRLAAFMPEKIECAVLVAPAGVALGSKLKMIKDILVPLLIYKMNGSAKSLKQIANVMSFNTMNSLDESIIGNIFKYTYLEQEMPKLTSAEELKKYGAPTLVITGTEDVFFPEKQSSQKTAGLFGDQLELKRYSMGHFPSEEYLEKIDTDIKTFLKKNYN